MATRGLDKLYAELGIKKPEATQGDFLTDTSSFSFKAAQNMDAYQREEEQRIKDLAEGRVRTSLRTLTPTSKTTVAPATIGKARVVGNGAAQPIVTPTVVGTFQALGGSIAKGAVNLVRQVATSGIAGQNILKRGLQTMFDTPVLDVRKNISEQVVSAGKKLWEQNKEEIVKTQQNSEVVKSLQEAETAVKNWANAENQAEPIKFVSGLFESAPQSVATAIPIVGWTMLGSSAFLNGLEQAKTEAEVAGQDPNSDKVMLRALGSMGVEIATESIFGLWKPIGGAVSKTGFANASRGFLDSVTAKLFKQTGKDAAELSAKTVWKQIARQSFEEGVEEAVAELGNALVIRATTDPSRPMPVFKDYMLAYLGGALMGGGMTGLRSVPALNGIRKLNNFKKVLKTNENQTIPELVENQDIAQALAEDLKDPEVQDALTETMFKSVEAYGNRPAPTQEQVAEIPTPAEILGQMQEYGQRDTNGIFQDLLNPQAKQSDLPQSWYDYLNQPVILEQAMPEPVQAPGSPLQTQDTSMPAEAVQAPPTAPQRATQASYDRKVTGVQGKKVLSSAATGEDIETTINATPASEVVASMDADLVVNPNYDERLQPRDTDRIGSEKLVDKIARNPKIRDLFGTESLQDGMPVIGDNGMVVAGNHRVAGIMRMMKINPEGYELYKQYALANASQLGLDPRKLTGDFIVTRVAPEGTDLVDLADKSNINKTRRMSPNEYAKRDSGKLTKEIMSRFFANEDGEINNRANNEFIQQYLGQIVPESERDAYADADGNINQDGVARIRNAIFYKAYGSTRLLDLIAESTDNNVKRLTTSLVNVAPRISALKEGIASGDLFNIDLANLFTTSAERWVNMKQQKTPVLMYAMQSDLTDTPDTIRAKNFLLAMDVNKASAGKLTDFYNTLIDAVTVAGSPKQVGFFANITPKMDDILQVAINKGGYTDAAQIELQSEDSQGTGTQIETARTEAKEPAKAEVKPEVASAITQEPTVKIGSKNYTQKAIENSLAKLRKRAENPLNDSDRQEIANNIAKLNMALVKLTTPTTVQPSQSFEEVVGKSSEAQDTSGRMGIVAPGFAPAAMGTTANTILNYEGPQNPNVRQAVDEARRPVLKGKGSDITVSKLKDFVTRNFLRSSIPETSYENGEIRREVIRLRKRWGITATLTEQAIKSIYNPLGTAYKQQMDYAVLLPDLVEDIYLGKYDNQQLPLGFASKQEVIDENDRLKQLIADKSDPNVAKALDIRKTEYKAITDRIMALANKTGVDMSSFFKRDEYMHHEIIDYLNQATVNPEFKKTVTGLLRTRNGSQKAYITDAAIADFLAMRKLLEIEMKFETMIEMQEYDTKSKTVLKKDASGEYILEDGYVEVDSSLISFVFPQDMLKNQAVSVTKDVLKKNNIPLDGDIAKKLLAEADKTERNLKFILPTDIASALHSVFTPKQEVKGFEKLFRLGIHAQKSLFLKSPRRILPYQLRNSISDLGKLAGVDPAALQNTFRAVGMLTDFYMGKKTNPIILEYIREGGLETGLAQIELGDYRALSSFNFYDKEGNLKPIKAVAMALSKGMGGIEKVYQWREQIFRLAAFMHMKEKVLNNPKGLPANGNYYSSVPAEIKSIRTKNGRAFKIANDIVGAYDDTSPFTQFMSQLIQPFFRYQETSNKAYYRSLKNSFYKDPDLVMTSGFKWAKRFQATSKIGASAAWKIGKLAFTLQALELAMHLFNRFLRKDEDDQVPSYAREQSHITLGNWNGKVWYISNVGSLREALSWIGWSDVYNDVEDILNGKFSFEDKVKEMVQAPYNKLTDNMLPILMPIVELKMGKRMFNDVEIKDNWEYVFNSLQMGDLYKTVTGKPRMDGQFNLNFSPFSRVMEKENYMWDIYTLKDQYLASIGETPADFGSSKKPKNVALYNFRTAVRLNDKAAALRYLKEYYVYGGNLDGVNASARGLDPLSGMKAEYKDAFLAQLQGKDWETYQKGMEYYEQYASDMVRIAEFAGSPETE